MKAFILFVLVALAGLGIWRVMANRVDFAKPEAVAKAFTSALRSNNISKASKYWVPADAATWATSAQGKIDAMQSGTYARFFEDLTDGSTPFIDVPRATNSKRPSNEKSMRAGGTTIDLRELEGKWFVCNAPL